MPTRQKPRNPFDETEINESLNPMEEPIEMIDREIKRTKQSRIPITERSESTWEREDLLKQKYPYLFPNP